MRTHLTIKLKKITTVAKELNKAIRYDYNKNSWTARGTKLCIMRSLLGERISQVEDVMYAMELEGLRARIQSERKPALPKDYTVYSTNTRALFVEAKVAVDKIMEAIRKYVENPNTTLSLNY